MNYNTQNAKIASITEKTLIVGIDVGSETHFARAFDWRNFEYTRKPLEFSNTEAGFQSFKAWVEDIAQKHGKTAVIPGMEPTGHYWLALGKFLQDNGMKPVHVNPHHVKKSKELDDNNPNKNDRKDPKTIAALVNEGRFSYPYIPTGVYAEVRSLSNLRFQTQEEITRIKNRIARWFAIYFPEYKGVYGDLKAVSGRMVLKVAPLPEDIRKLGVEGVNRIWRDAKLRGAGKKSYVDKLIAIKGIGLATVSGFIAEVGDIKRFDDPRQLQKLAGYAIVADDSGKHAGESRISYRGRKRLRYVLYEAAISLIGKNEEFREIHEYYRARKENPLKKMQSVVAVACKILRVFYVILTKGVDYDPEKMMRDIRRPELQAA